MNRSRSNAQLVCFVTLLSVIYVMVGCRQNSTPAAAPIVGRWETGVQETEWGLARIRLVFRERDLEFVFLPKGEANKPMTSKGDYRAIDGLIISPVLNGGEAVPFTIASDTLTLKLSPNPMILERVR